MIKSITISVEEDSGLTKLVDCCGWFGNGNYWSKRF